MCVYTHQHDERTKFEFDGKLRVLQLALGFPGIRAVHGW